MHLQPGSAQSEHSCAVHKFNQHGLSMLPGGCNTVSWKTWEKVVRWISHCPGCHEEDLWQPGPAISNVRLGCHKDVFDFHLIRNLITFCVVDLTLSHFIIGAGRKTLTLTNQSSKKIHRGPTVADRSCEERRTGAAKEAMVWPSRIRVQSHMDEGHGSISTWPMIHDFRMFYFSENITDYMDTNASNCI